MVRKSAPRHPAWLVLSACLFGFAATTVWAWTLYVSEASLLRQLFAGGFAVANGFFLVRECVFVFRRSGPWSPD